MGEEERKKPTRRVNELRRLIDSGRLPVGTHLTHRGRKIGLERIASWCKTVCVLVTKRMRVSRLRRVPWLEVLAVRVWRVDRPAT
jgi:hypothetical protein